MSLPLPPPKPRLKNIPKSTPAALRQMMREYDQKPFDPEAPVERPRQHVYLNNPRRPTTTGRNARGGLDDETLTQLLDIELETMDVDSRTARDISSINSAIRDAAHAYHVKIWNILDYWVEENQGKLDWTSPELTADEGGLLSAVSVMDSNNAAYLYFMEAECAGVGTWDGDWDTFFKDPYKSIKQLSKFVEEQSHDEYMALKNALVDRAFELMDEHGLSTMEAKPRSKTITSKGNRMTVVLEGEPGWVIARDKHGHLVLCNKNPHTKKWDLLEWFKADEMDEARGALSNRSKKQKHVSGYEESYHAQPYNTSATGFYFHDLDEWNQKFKAAKRRGIEEFELQFINGSTEDAYLFEGLGISGGTIDKWFEEIQGLNDYEKAGLYGLVKLSGVSDLDEALEKVKEDNPVVFEGTVLEYAQNYIDDIGGVEQLGKQAQSYFDYESYGQAIKNNILTASDDEDEQERVEGMSDYEIGEQYADDFGWEGVGKENIERFFDYEKFARDLELGGDVSEFGFARRTFVLDNNR